MAVYNHNLRVFVLISVLVLTGCTKKEEAQSRPLTAQEERGERLYRAACAGCHRANSTDPLNGPGMKGLFKKQFTPSGMPANDERVTEVIKRGKRMMPGFGQLYDDRQIADLVAYLKTL
jgi:mono/diheme cytochrome c family protein